MPPSQSNSAINSSLPNRSTSPTPSAPPRWRVAVLSGGESAERDVSLLSGEAVARALRCAEHQVTPVDPAAESDLASRDWSAFDVAFIALHGTFGEDGGVQSILDRAGVPYTGSPAEASRLAFSKAEAKERFFACEVPTPDYHLLVAGASETMVRRAADHVGYPLVVKPDRQGSSLGVSLVNSPGELAAAWELARQFDSRILIEQAILGEEWTVPLLDQQTLPAIKIGTRRPFFDYHAKYVDEQTTYSFLADVPAAVVRTIEDAALRACRALGTRGLARVDLRLDAAQRPWVLEVNTIPGMTDHSLVPKAAARLGWSMTDLCERAIESALRIFPAAGPNRHQPHLRPTSGRRPHLIPLNR